MLSQLLNPDSPRARFFWGLLAVVVLAQLVGIYMVCSEQVRQQHARENSVQMQRMALTDCLQYLPGSTIASCARQASGRQGEGNGFAQASAVQRSPVMATATPVNFSFR